MKLQKTAYELSQSQVTTPPNIVSLFWEVVKNYRKHFNRVLDMGAGDARFAVAKCYDQYDGVEIDSKKIRDVSNLKNVDIFNSCIFEHPFNNYDACIGNPPYVRHHDIETEWKFSTTKRIEEELEIKLDLHCNLYLYFMCFGILKTQQKGLVALVIPFEWVSRPSAAPIRNYIKRKKWNVSVYEFKESIFSKVLTTASISIVDKATSEGKWSFYSIDSNQNIKSRNGINESGTYILPYSPRGEVWARRGLSPGTQKVFTLTEDERKKAKLTHKDVRPCITTMKSLPRTVKKLNKKTFKKYFVDAGQRCWLIRSTDKKISRRLRKYLNNVHEDVRNTYTCVNHDPWYSYEKFSIPKFLFHSGFVKEGPKVLTNEIKAQAVGSVYGVLSKIRIKKKDKKDLTKFLLSYDFEKKIVPHANELKKVEVKQLNNVLNEWCLMRQNYARN
jgi:predicted RNA methylase